ncbi:hypothetical protein MMC19_006984 [Ptychographa xylographoides]|nr:hypothetical protein [Ptychographa xylographoides]
MKATTQLLLLRPSSYTSLSRPVLSSISSNIALIRNPLLPSKSHKTQRQFATNPFSPSPQTLHATKTLPYEAADLYALIADIAAYPSFLPYCTSSTITSWSSPHPDTGKKYPRSASLAVGFQSYTESFHSHVFCAPDNIVEAVCGDARTSISKSQLPHYPTQDAKGEQPASYSAELEKQANPIFTSLLTRWSLRSFPYKPPPPSGKSPQEGNATAPSKPRTEVDLHIEVQFANAVYSALSQAAAPKVAGMMVEAFERRAREVLGEGDLGERMIGEKEKNPGHGVAKSALDGDISQKERP